jgi:hypothetical protein
MKVWENSKVRIVDEKLILYTCMKQNAELLGELVSGDEIELGQSKKIQGTIWCEVKLADGRHAYALGGFKIYMVRSAAVRKKKADLYELPTTQSPVKISFRKDEKLYITDFKIDKKNKIWLKVHDLSGTNRGFIEIGSVKMIDGRGEGLNNYFTAGEEVAGEEEGEAKGALFSKSNYLPFMLGVFFFGGLLLIPFAWGYWVSLSYFSALLWSLGLCLVFLIAFRMNGTISWDRITPAMAGFTAIEAMIYNFPNLPSFISYVSVFAGGLLGFLPLLICGYLGIGIRKLFGFGKRSNKHTENE